MSLSRSQQMRRVHADQMVQRGEIDRAKGYCAKFGLPWPPRPATGVETRELPPPASEAEVELDKELEALRARMDAELQETFSTVVPVEAEVPVLPPAAAVGAPVCDPVAPVAAVETPSVRRARVTNYVPNPRLVGIKFEDGPKERSSMWRSQRTPRINDVVTVKRERGVEGRNAIYEEVLPKL